MDDLTHGERAEVLLNNPDRYDDIRAYYNDDWECYRSLTRGPSGDISFDEFVTLVDTLTDRIGDRVLKRIKNNFPRSLKNMVLADSQNGRAYAAVTLATLHDRYTAFTTTSNRIDWPDFTDIVWVLLEHLYDEDQYEQQAYGILSGLLADTAGVPRDTVELVARARVVESLMLPGDTERRLPHEVTNYLSTVPSPDVDADGDADELLAVAADTPFRKSEKRELLEAALHRDETNSTFLRYLFVVSRDIIEQYRHGDQDDPRRGGLLYARRAFEVLDSRVWDAFNEADQAYVESYFQVARALRFAGAVWRTDKDPAQWPDPKWEKCAEAYASAAYAVKGVNTERRVKYLSKAYRHAAHGTDAITGKYYIHDAAISMFTSFLEDRDDTDLVQTVQGAIRVHKARKTTLELMQAYSNREYEAALEKVDEVNKIVENVPQAQLNTREVNLFEKMARARLRANECAFSDALEICEWYEESDRRLEALKALLRMKQCIRNGAVEEAASAVASAFDEGTAVRFAVDSLADQELSNPGAPTAMDAVPDVPQGCEQALFEGARLVRREPDDESVRTAVRELLTQEF